MGKLTESERLVKVETLLEKLYQEFSDFRLEMKEASVHYVSQQKHSDDMLDVKNELVRTKKRIDEVERKRWVQNTLSAILGAVLTFFVSYFVTNIGG
jgi:hypothetical protein